MPDSRPPVRIVASQRFTFDPAVSNSTVLLGAEPVGPAPGALASPTPLSGIAIVALKDLAALQQRGHFLTRGSLLDASPN